MAGFFRTWTSARPLPAPQQPSPVPSSASTRLEPCPQGTAAVQASPVVLRALPGASLSLWPSSPDLPAVCVLYQKLFSLFLIQLSSVLQAVTSTPKGSINVL